MEGMDEEGINKLNILSLLLFSVDDQGVTLKWSFETITQAYWKI